MKDCTETPVFKPYAILLSDEGEKVLPDSMLQHLHKGNQLFLVRPIENGKAFISTHKDYTGHLCTYVNANDISKDPWQPYTFSCLNNAGIPDRSLRKLADGCEIHLRYRNAEMLQEVTVEIATDTIWFFDTKSRPISTEVSLKNSQKWADQVANEYLHELKNIVDEAVANIDGK